MMALILAGGGGTRLWPVSRKQRPKQVESIVGEHSMLKATWNRLAGGFRPEDIFVATAEGQADEVMAQLPDLPPENVVREPCRRDTASAIGYALLRASERRPDDTFVVINSDAHVRDAEAYLEAISSAGKAVEEHGRTVLIGIRPEYPETGYGYIRMGDRRYAATGGHELREVDAFVEKPDRPTAESYLADGRHLWNPTLVVGRVSDFLEMYDRHLPDHARIFAEMRSCFGSADEASRIAQLFARLPGVSIDYGILEKETGMLAMPAEFGWMDIGNWRTVMEVLADGGDNVVRGRHVGVDSTGNLVYSKSGRLVATVGISDTVIVETEDAILICPNDRAHDVKRLVKELEADERLKRFT